MDVLQLQQALLKASQDDVKAFRDYLPFPSFKSLLDRAATAFKSESTLLEVRSCSSLLLCYLRPQLGIP